MIVYNSIIGNKKTSTKQNDHAIISITETTQSVYNN